MKTVLVVDDNKCIRDILQMVLGAFPGCSVRTAANGAEAITVMNAQPVDAVITDISMPVMGGYELIRHIRTVSDMPVMAMSADPRPCVQVELGKVGISRYFEKPFNLEEVAREIAAVLGLSQNASMPAPRSARLYQTI